MDITVIAAVGSFVVSERVLKPKATVLFILGCVLIFDLTTKTKDVSSLRVYRGEYLKGMVQLTHGGYVSRQCQSLLPPVSGNSKHQMQCHFYFPFRVCVFLFVRSPI